MYAHVHLSMDVLQCIMCNLDTGVSGCVARCSPVQLTRLERMGKLIKCWE